MVTGSAQGDVIAALTLMPNPGKVAQNVLGELLRGVFVLTAWVLAAALAVLVIAVLSGPYQWAVAIRSRVKRTGRSIAGARSGDRRGQVVTWITSHAAGLQRAGAVAAGILPRIVSVSWLSFLIVGVLPAACEICLHRIKPPPPDKAPPASRPANQAGLPSHIGETSGQDPQPAHPARRMDPPRVLHPHRLRHRGLPT